MRLIDADAYIHKGDLENEPTIDAEPVRYGKWRQTRITLMADYYMCSECGVELKLDFISEFKKPPVTYNYCPNCGAKMG